MSPERVSIKDIYSQLAEMKGQMTTLVGLIPKVGENENNIIRLQESDGYLKEGMRQIGQEIKESQKRNLQILVAIGVAAILAGAFGDLVIGKLFV